MTGVGPQVDGRGALGVTVVRPKDDGRGASDDGGGASGWNWVRVRLPWAGRKGGILDGFEQAEWSKYNQGGFETRPYLL